jgi:endonuclease G
MYPRNVLFKATTVSALVVLTCWVRLGAEVCPGSRVHKADLAKYDQHLTLSPAMTKTALKTHAPWGMPECAPLLPLREYVVCYDAAHRIPRLVSYALNAADIITEIRSDAFRTDPRLSADQSAACADYRGSGYDRGHGVPRGDMNRTPEVQADTFLLSNMAPQTPALNRGMWRWLEEDTRAWATKFHRVYIISGPVFIGDDNHLPSGRVGIPVEFYKIIIRKDTTGRLHAMAFLLPNDTSLPVPPGTMGVAGPRINAQQADQYLLSHAVSIQAIQSLTGLELLPNLSAASKQAVESSVTTALWPKQ